MIANLTFIGAGNMASSLIGGLLAKGYPADRITATDAQPETLERIKNALYINTTTDNLEAVNNANAVILAVKPQSMKAVALELAPALQKRKPLVISIAAGINLSSLEKWLGSGLAIVRCMPNTPALIQQGATGLFANKNTSEADKTLAQNILEAVGLALWLDTENQLDAVTALSGSGPAYFFLMIEAMEQAGIKLGLNEKTARQLTLQTALGAAAMAQGSSDTPEELRKKVTSPGGTTEQAIHSFQQSKFNLIVQTAVEAANARSIGLSSELGE
ncbi:MAG: pyrroline-5-carboxylate reductase [Pseudomonadales bacterium]|nr:pyrroline-5-carboxylate reductase [Pseudomonadales bacterium]